MLQNPLRRISARGVDTLARQAAKLLGLPIWEIYPQYQLYGRTAPLIRNHTRSSFSIFSAR